MLRSPESAHKTSARLCAHLPSRRVETKTVEIAGRLLVPPQAVRAALRPSAPNTHAANTPSVVTSV